MARALHIKRGDVVSFVGGGGKTTSMFRLASELSAAQFRVVTTTTTHISKEQVSMAPASVTLEELHMLGSRLDHFGQCLVVGPPDGKGRVFGASSDLIEALHARPDVDAILIEADGSRSLPFKAPGHHEPVVPGITTILAPIAGMHVLGQPLDEAHVHRSENVAAISQQAPGSPITPQTLARVLAHLEGGAKQCPEGARLAPILNRVDIETAMSKACEAAEMLLASPSVDTVVLGAVKQDPPVREAWVHTAGIILAGGNGPRNDSAKTANSSGGTASAVRAARIALDAGLNPVIVVSDCLAEMIEKSLGELAVQWIAKPHAEAGQSACLRKGLEALPPGTGAAVFLPVDQSPPTPDFLKAIVQAHRKSFAPACVPVFDGRRDYPVLLDRTLFPRLAKLRGEAGVWNLIEKFTSEIVEVPVGPGIWGV